MEVWKTCIHHNPKYMVSNYGNILSFRQNKKGKIIKGFKDWKGKNRKSGYYLCLHGLNKGKLYIHNLVMYYFYRPRPDNLVIDHINRIKHDNRISNLRYITHRDNLLNTEKGKKYTETDPILRQRERRRFRYHKNKKIDRKVNCLCGNKIRDGKFYQILHLKSKYHKNFMLKIKNEIKETSLQAI